MKPVLVFDWNGTLLDDAHALLQTTNAILNRFGYAPINMETFREHCDLPLSLLYRNLGMSQDEVAAVDRDGSAVFHNTYEPLADRADLREGARRVLELAHREAALSVIVSNHIVAPLRSQLRRLGIHDYINEALAFESRATQYKSMSKGERLRLYMQKYSLDPASTFIIGDMPIEMDIARNLALISISITGGFVSDSRLRAANPDYSINNHHELLPILQRHGFF
ncbi:MULTISPECIES: HAD family hydrolase [Bradyrhizobium]|uniref:phosphoglycolate phosphatase n=3 Tax=Bradyrhizobium TaxID=374 RepID=A0AAE5X853_9BRAD|nr:MULTISPECIES: HAD family hydrolase [Bradyrhizobium]MCG2631959.1 HAD family hydrolase [Bradyrhizobium zhengyangense]MCG2645014.1 HAD family hydrolase [Bradyrhizobium zhengyangense]MCG2672752.1 HAD family hydrolase [Bradyrhizobium zhengyangense]MDN4985397.1 HAD family hydrolase [Bradyrhizobium sp. WYCCWR 13022]MDN5002372.1 HAD family hydrolase [Bradyrhizobium sp. WYCCWR 12677]